jgi:hypothetical protein
LAAGFNRREYLYADAVGRFVEQITDALDPLALILFGSLAATITNAVMATSVLSSHETRILLSPATIRLLPSTPPAWYNRSCTAPDSSGG